MYCADRHGGGGPDESLLSWSPLMNFCFGGPHKQMLANSLMLADWNDALKYSSEPCSSGRQHMLEHLDSRNWPCWGRKKRTQSLQGRKRVGLGRGGVGGWIWLQHIVWDSQRTNQNFKMTFVSVSEIRDAFGSKMYMWMAFNFLITLLMVFFSSSLLPPPHPHQAFWS